LIDYLRWPGSKADHVAIAYLRHFGDASLGSKCSVRNEMRCLAMHRHKNARAGPLIHLAQFVPAGMSRNVDERITVLHDLDALFDEKILRLQDRLLIAWNDARRIDDSVARRERDVAHLVAGQLGKGRTWLTLATGAKDHQVLPWDEAIVLLLDHLRQSVQ